MVLDFAQTGRPYRFSWWVFTLLLLTTELARAQPSTQPPTPAETAPEAPTAPSEANPSADPPGYAEAIEAGLTEYDHGNYEEALVHFLRAHELFANARTERALGNVAFELRNYGEAATHLSRALASDVKPLEGKLKEDTEKLLARAKVYVGEIHVDVEPDAATVSVDGVTVARGPKAMLALLVGEHVLEFRASGRLPERRAVQVRGGERTLLQVVLPEAEALSRPHIAPAAPARDEPKPLRKQWWLWTAVGAAAAAVAIGVGVAVARDGTSTPTSGGTIGAVLEAP